ncbi:MAG: carboxypeptidase-like regulatory domain-containing protein [Bacteroidetes bacterium]|nr:carboxypeptidase-like regulatory domain-containing protein [Bacteroidota bacterium]
MKTLVAFILLANAVVYSQANGIKGLIRDAETHAPLPYANIQLAKTPLGTASNLDGEFLLRVSSFPVQIIVSYVGYQTNTIQVEEKDASKIIEISLKRAEIVFPEVTVSASDTFAINLVKRVYEKITDNEDRVINGDGFYRQYLKVDSQYSEIMEMFLSTLLNSRGILKSGVENGRYARLKRAKGDTVLPFYLTNMSYFSTVTFKSSQHKDPFFSFLPFVHKPGLYVPLRPNADEYYYLKTDGFYRTDDGEKVAIITFTPKIDLDRPTFSGSMEIEVNNSRLLRINEKLDGLRHNLVPWPSFMGYYVRDSILSFRADFKDVSNGNFYLDRLETRYEFMERNEKDPSFNRQYSFVSFLTFYDYPEKANTSKLEDSNQEWDINKVINAGYNPDFWKKHQDVINEIPIEESIRESFIKHGFYGNLFPGGEPLNEK